MNSLFLCLLNVTIGEIIVLWLTFMAGIVLLQERQGEKREEERKGGRRIKEQRKNFQESEN